MEQILGKDKGSMKRFFHMLQKAKLPYLWILGYILIAAFLSNIGISVTEYTAEMFAGNVGLGKVILPFLFYTILSLFIGSVSGIVKELCTARIDRNFRRMIWKKTVHLPLSFYAQNSSRELISRITTDVAEISRLIMLVFVEIITTGYTLFITFRKIGSYDGRLMFSLLAVLPLNILIAFIVGKFQFGIMDNVNRKNAELTGHVSERMNHFLLMKAFGNERREQAAGEEKMKGLYKSKILNAWTQLSMPVYAIADVMQFIVIVMVGRKFYADGSLSLANWIAYYGFGINIVNILTAYCGYWTSFKNSQGATNRVAQVMEAPEEDLLAGEEAGRLQGEICLSHVAFSYGEKQVFQDLSLGIPAGCVTAIIGPSGSGKTTLLNLIERMYPIDSGSITIGGKDISRYSLKSYRSQISYLTQETTMFSGTIRDNLLFGIDGPVSGEKLREACEKAGIYEFISSVRQGFDQQVGEDGNLLSGGQKQRLAIARAILKDADCLFLDEATSAMDVRSKEHVFGGLKGDGTKTVVMVAHDRQTIAKADYIIVLAKGNVAAAGPASELFKTCVYCRKLMGKED